MMILKEGVDPDRFFEALAGSRARILFLDYDGTLAPFREDRDKAVPYGGVKELLERLLIDVRCRTVIISGRSIRDLVPLLGLSRFPEIWGCHGFERMLPSGEYSARDLDPGLRTVLENIKGLCAGAGFSERCEIKPFSAAVHWRGANESERAAIEELLESKIIPIAMEKGLVTRRFLGGVEFIQDGADKGTAVAEVLDSYQEKVAAAFLGDDSTDEDAFRAIEGRGLSVLVAPAPRETAADIWIEPPSGLIEFLGKWISSCGAEK